MEASMQPTPITDMCTIGVSATDQDDALAFFVEESCECARG